MPLLGPMLLIAVGAALALAFLRPGLGIVVAVFLLLLLPGRWWRWRTRRFRRGLRALERGDTASARAELESFLSRLDADASFAKLQPYFNLGRRYSYQAAALSNLGIAELQEGRPEDAVARFRAALSADEYFVQALYGQAAALRLLGDLGAAETSAERALLLRPKYHAARALLGLVQLERGDEEGSAATLAPLHEAGKDPDRLLDRLRSQWPEGRAG